MLKSFIKITFPLFLFFSASSNAATNIAILVDGKSQFYDELIELYEKEIIELTEGEFEVKFNTYIPGNGGWTYKNIQNKYYDLQASQDIDIVLALGLVSSLVATYDPAPKKPTFAPYVIDADFPGIREKDLPAAYLI